MQAGRKHISLAPECTWLYWDHQSLCESAMSDAELLLYYRLPPNRAVDFLHLLLKKKKKSKKKLPANFSFPLPCVKVEVDIVNVEKKIFLCLLRSVSTIRPHGYDGNSKQQQHGCLHCWQLHQLV